MPHRIFIIEDQAIFLEGLLAIFELIPEVTVVGAAKTGAAALDFFEKNELPDVILLDYNLPDMDGLEIAQRLLAARPEAKILALTGYDDLGLVKKMLEVGARGYLLKDSNSKEDLRLAIEIVARGKKHIDEALLEKFVAGAPIAKGSAFGAEKLPQNPLSLREMEVARLVATGFRSKEIAAQLFISLNTVETHRKNIYSKTTTENPVQLRTWMERIQAL